jgi:Flp pilus assembly protein TadG
MRRILMAMGDAKHHQVGTRTARLRLAAACFGCDRSGVVAVLFGLMLLPIMMAVGAAVDYSIASRTKVSLDVAADAAVMAAIRRAALADRPQDAEEGVRALFSRATVAVAPVTMKSLKIQVRDNNGVRTARLEYEATVPVRFMAVAGFGAMTVAGESVGSSGVPTYIDFHLLLDNTPSMGLGATAADINTLVKKTGCAFACHDLSANGKDAYAKAKQHGVQMRIDVVRQATQNLMDTAAATSLVPNQFRTAIYSFGSSCTAPGLTTISPLTPNHATAKTNAAVLDLMTIPYQNYNNDQCTDFDRVIAAVDREIPAARDGGSQANPQQVLFLVSDGVADAYYPSTCSKPTTGGRCQEPLKPANCAALKSRGVRIAVLYTTYLPITDNGWYNTWIAPFQSSIGTTMQACASPGLYFEVSPTQGISEALSALFQKAVSQARLTG